MHTDLQMDMLAKTSANLALQAWGSMPDCIAVIIGYKDNEYVITWLKYGLQHVVGLIYYLVVVRNAQKHLCIINKIRQEANVFQIIN